MGIIYFVEIKDRGIFKIGKSKSEQSLSRRVVGILSQLKTNKDDIYDPTILDSRIELYRYKKLACYDHIEKEIHSALNKIHYNMFRSIDDREWFSIRRHSIDEIIYTCLNGNTLSFSESFKKTKLYARLLEMKIDNDILCYREGDIWLADYVRASRIIENISEREKIELSISTQRKKMWVSIKKELGEDVSFYENLYFENRKNSQKST